MYQMMMYQIKGKIKLKNYMIVLKLVRIYKNLKMLHEIFQLLTNLNNTYKTKYVKQLRVTDLTQINKDCL